MPKIKVELTKHQVLEIAKEYNRYVKEHGKMPSEESKNQWFKEHQGFTIKTFQNKIADLDLNLKLRGGFYDIEGEPVDGQLSLVNENDTTQEAIKDTERGDNMKNEVQDTSKNKNTNKEVTRADNMVRTSLYIDKDILKSVKMKALSEDTSFNEITRQLLYKYLKGEIKL